jgi:HSP90 family molecular chaperone
MGLEESSVHLYSRKVLIKQNCRELLPQWLRFVKGIVDCEDIPLNISREGFQDSALIARIRHILTTRIIRMLLSEAEKEPRQYIIWSEEFTQFIKEGLATDRDHMREIAPLARFWRSGRDQMISLNDYVDSMIPGQKAIYYLFCPSKEAAEQSPYMDAFKPKGIPVLFSYHHVDEMIFRNMADFKGHKFVNIESSIDELDKENISTTEYNEKAGVPEEDLNTFVEWVKNELGTKVKNVVISHRLRDSPAVVIGEMSSAMR